MGIEVAGLGPPAELGDVHPPAAGFGGVHSLLGDLERIGQLALREPRRLPKLPEQRRNHPVVTMMKGTHRHARLSGIGLLTIKRCRT